MATDTFNSVAGLSRALKKLPKEASARLRDASVEIAQDVAERSRAKGMGIGRSWKYVAPTIKATRDRIPVIKFGGSTRLPNRTGSNRKNQTVGNLIWGTEFGGGRRPTTRQFLPHLGKVGYAIYPTIVAMNQDIRSAYSEALDKALQDI